MASLQTELLNSAWKHNNMVFHTWLPTCSPTIFSLSNHKNKEASNNTFLKSLESWAQVLVQMASVLSLSPASSAFFLPHIHQTVRNIMHSHPSHGSLVVQADELLHPSAQQWTLVLSGPILSSELTANKQILYLGLVEIKMPKCPGHRVPRHATRNIQDEPNTGKKLPSVHVLGPS